MANERDSIIGRAIGGSKPVVPRPAQSQGTNPEKVKAYLGKQKNRRGKWNSQVPTTSARKR